MRRLSRGCGVRIEAEGRAPEAAGDRVVVVANHSSPLDIAVFVQCLPGARFVAAAELFRVPLLAAAMRGLDTVPIDRRDRWPARPTDFRSEGTVRTAGPGGPWAGRAFDREHRALPRP